MILFCFSISIYIICKFLYLLDIKLKLHYIKYKNEYGKKRTR